VAERNYNEENQNSFMILRVVTITWGGRAEEKTLLAGVTDCCSNLILLSSR